MTAIDVSTCSITTTVVDGTTRREGELLKMTLCITLKFKFSQYRKESVRDLRVGYRGWL